MGCVVVVVVVVEDYQCILHLISISWLASGESVLFS